MSTVEPNVQSEAGPSNLKREPILPEKKPAEPTLMKADGGPQAEQSTATPSKKPKKVKQRAENPKVYGDIPGYPVGSRWKYRQEISDCGVHPGIIAGIFGDKNNGAYSIILAEGYPDDEDNGYTFIYTGCGGRETGKRLGPQVIDQSFENPRNLSLKMSTVTRNPVRVIRKATPKSDWAPAEGFRYDGLYYVDDAWMETGASGLMVCRYRLRRKEGQPPLARKEGSINVKIPKPRKRRTPEPGSVASSDRPIKRNKPEPLTSSAPHAGPSRSADTKPSIHALVPNPLPTQAPDVASVNREASAAEQSYFLDLMAEDDEVTFDDEENAFRLMEEGMRYQSPPASDKTGPADTDSHGEDATFTPFSERPFTADEVHIVKPENEIEEGASVGSQTSRLAAEELESQLGLALEKPPVPDPAIATREFAGYLAATQDTPAVPRSSTKLMQPLPADRVPALVGGGASPLAQVSVSPGDTLPLANDIPSSDDFPPPPTWYKSSRGRMVLLPPARNINFALDNVTKFSETERNPTTTTTTDFDNLQLMYPEDVSPVVSDDYDIEEGEVVDEDGEVVIEDRKPDVGNEAMDIEDGELGVEDGELTQTDI